MELLERQLSERFPKWFRGRRGVLVRPLLRGFAHWSGLPQLARFLDDHRHLQGFALIEAAMPFLALRYDIEAADLARIPARGRLVIVANHPSGAVDALALLHAVGSVRRDVRIVANDFLSRIEGLSELLLPVRILGGTPGAGSLAAVEAALEADQCVIVFPAGEVSRLGARGVTDTRWRRGFLRFSRNSGAPVMPVRIEARNSALFYGAAALSRPVGTALLPREMLKRGGRRINLRVGPLMQLDHATAPETLLADIRKVLYSLGRRSAPAAQPEALADAVPVPVLRGAVAGLQTLGETTDGKRICLGSLAPESPLLREIGRLRELTFRAVGEGTGRALDLDRFDLHYEHIVLWDEQAGKVAGAYRIARGARVLASQGLAGLYTATLFRYDDAQLPRLAEGMELGRSFVAPEYWGSRGIDYLWQGIGAYLQRHRGVRYLFGAVSLSAALPVGAREQIVAYYDRYHGPGEGGAVSRHPFRYLDVPPDYGALDADGAFAVLKGNLDALGVTLPMLYKQYTELCEPGGARFLAFGVDPGFADSTDGLIEVDLHRMRARKRQRYLEPRPQRSGAAA